MAERKRWCSMTTKNVVTEQPQPIQWQLLSDNNGHNNIFVAKKNEVYVIEGQFREFWLSNTLTDGYYDFHLADSEEANSNYKEFDRTHSFSSLEAATDFFFKNTSKIKSPVPLEDITTIQDFLDFSGLKKESVKSVLDEILSRSREELFSTKPDELDKYWHFKFNPNLPIELNLYNFHQHLETYSSNCRKWEEHHNGSSGVVGRLRDKHLMPKIREFVYSFSPQANIIREAVDRNA